MRTTALTAGLLALFVFCFEGGPVWAGIRCANGFQEVGRGLIATPYCQDELLFRVAREYGFKTTAEAIRSNPNHKRNICQFIGRDIRAQQPCIDGNNAGRRGF